MIKLSDDNCVFVIQPLNGELIIIKINMKYIILLIVGNIIFDNGMFIKWSYIK